MGGQCVELGGAHGAVGVCGDGAGVGSVDEVAYVGGEGAGGHAAGAEQHAHRVVASRHDSAAATAGSPDVTTAVAR